MVKGDEYSSMQNVQENFQHFHCVQALKVYSVSRNFWASPVVAIKCLKPRHGVNKTLTGLPGCEVLAAV